MTRIRYGWICRYALGRRSSLYPEAIAPILEGIAAKVRLFATLCRFLADRLHCRALGACSGCRIQPDIQFTACPCRQPRLRLAIITDRTSGADSNFSVCIRREDRE